MRKLMFSIFKVFTKILSGKGFGSFAIVYKIYSTLFEHLGPRDITLVDVQGNKMYLNPSGKGVSLSLLTKGTYEEFETELFKKEVKKGMIVLDIGANIGYYTLIAANLVGENGKIFAFEPEPNNFALLKKNVEINGYKNVILIQKAVSDICGMTKLFLSSEDESAHGMFKVNNRKSITIETITLDEFFNKGQKIDVVKMDIEGAEMLALLGSERMIRENDKLAIFSEFRPEDIKRSGLSGEDYLAALMEYGFRLFNINRLRKFLEPVSEPKSICKTNTNLLCKRN